MIKIVRSREIRLACFSENYQARFFSKFTLHKSINLIMEVSIVSILSETTLGNASE